MKTQADKFEYKFYHDTGSLHTLKDLNKLGQEGWEVCGWYNHHSKVLLKRKVVGKKGTK